MTMKVTVWNQVKISNLVQFKLNWVRQKSPLSGLILPDQHQMFNNIWPKASACTPPANCVLIKIMKNYFYETKQKTRALHHFLACFAQCPLHDQWATKIQEFNDQSLNILTVQILCKTEIIAVHKLDLNT